MKWVEKLLDKLGDAVEMQSPGTISWRFDEVESWLQVAPSRLERVGGANDGESIFPFYSLDISELIEVFDEFPAMHWNSMHDEFSVEGKIDGDDAWITFSRDPFDDEEPEDVIDRKGGIRKKKLPTK